MYVAAPNESTCAGEYQFGPRVCPCGEGTTSVTASRTGTRSQAASHSRSQTQSSSVSLSASATPSTPRVVRSLVPCELGTWCGLGRALSEGPALTCPPGAACNSPALLEPVTCNLGGNCSSLSCPHIPYCPAGTIQEELCPAGATGTRCTPASISLHSTDASLQDHTVPTRP